jgi:plasmid maintenance system antidote protein VapI
MLLNNIEVDVKIKCIEKDTTQTMLADGVGTSPSYVSRIVKSKEHIVNKTFIAMMEQLGYDVELTYVKRVNQ